MVQEINFGSNSGGARKQDLGKGGLVRDFENFHFFHLEIPRTREKRVVVEHGNSFTIQRL
jgi:hypothetical protein